MNSITFKNIYNAGEIYSETEMYTQYHLPEMPLYYDSNFMAFTKMPTVSEFQKAEQAQLLVHKKHNQHHLKFTFPENEQLSKELTSYLERTGYDIGFLELYAIQPNDFPEIHPSPYIQMLPVDEENLEAFLHMQQTVDGQSGELFAEQKANQHRANFTNPNWLQLIAIVNGDIVGSVDCIIERDTVEIDGLHVVENMRHQGIGGQLQCYIMEHFSDKWVILVADGEDTARDMYQHQNYQLLGYQYEVIKS